VSEGFRIEPLDGDGVRLIGELDLASYDQAAHQLSRLLEPDGDVTLDISELSFVDSSGIRLFIRLHLALEGRGTLTLRSPTPQVARILRMSGVADVGIGVEESGQ
jgi:anti-sigma B factor antagonist